MVNTVRLSALQFLISGLWSAAFEANPNESRETRKSRNEKSEESIVAIEWKFRFSFYWKIVGCTENRVIEMDWLHYTIQSSGASTEFFISIASPSLLKWCHQKLPICYCPSETLHTREEAISLVKTEERRYSTVPNKKGNTGVINWSSKVAHSCVMQNEPFSIFL